MKGILSFLRDAASSRSHTEQCNSGYQIRDHINISRIEALASRDVGAGGGVPLSRQL